MVSTTRQSVGRPAGAARDDRRQAYIDAAGSIFYESGYDTATLGDLADRLGVTKAAVYYYFHGKEDLLYEIIREMHLLNLANLEATRAWQGTALERLDRYFRGHARINLDHLEKTTVVYRDLDHLSADRREEIVAVRDETQRFVRELVVEIIADGQACTLLNVELASIQMFAAVNSLHTWYRPGGAHAVEVVAQSVTDFVLSAVLCSGGTDASCSRHRPVTSLRHD